DVLLRKYMIVSFKGDLFLKMNAVDQKYLSIDEKTGEIFLHKPVDRKKHPCFYVSQKEIRPLFNKRTFNRKMIIPCSIIVDVQVTAQDMDERNTINSRFNIISLKLFSLFQKENKYTVTLQAKDHGDPPLSSTAEITINIVDRNTNMPVFKEREVRGAYMSGVGNSRLAVEDKDTPNTDGWRAKYFFISGNEEDIFKLETDPITNEGILSIIKEKNYEKNSWVDLQIGVENIEPFSKCEKGKLIKQGSKLYPPDSVSVKVLMIDSNDPPEFQKTKVDLFEKEESDPGKVLFTPEVHDPDSTSFRFELVDDPANWVSVDEKTGQIRAIKKMDRESPFVDADNVYKVVIAAIDDGDPPASSSCTISIHLRDTNDHKPQLVNNSLIMCGNMSNKVMLSVIDLDADPYSGPFHFSLDNDDNKKQWKLDPYYGQQGGLINLNPLSYGNYSISLVIEDQQNNIGRETLEVVVCDCENNTCHVKKALSFHLGVPAIYSMIAGLLLFLILLIGFSCSCKKHQFEQTEDKGYQTLVIYNKEGHLLKPIVSWL
uniref:Cadherin domain-containing protein n=1 Tax=Oryzias latipes TaxID=8090 RepID=A0A3P9L9E5_ORYLA